jgi:hypothetical protein
MVKAAYNVSVARLLGRSYPPVSTDEYKSTVIGAFSEKALEHGITEQEDIDEIADVYWQDISQIFDRVTGFMGAGTVGAYVPALKAALEAALIPLLVLAAFVYLFMLVLDRKSGTFYPVIPFAVQAFLFAAAYLILKNFALGRSFDAVQYALLSSAQTYMFFVLKISLALLLGAVLVFAINTIINLTIRGKKIGKEQEI